MFLGGVLPCDRDIIQEHFKDMAGLTYVIKDTQFQYKSQNVLCILLYIYIGQKIEFFGREIVQILKILYNAII